MAFEHRDQERQPELSTAQTYEPAEHGDGSTGEERGERAAEGVKAKARLIAVIATLLVAIAGITRHVPTGHFRSRSMLTYLVLPMSIGSAFGAVAGGYMAAWAPSDAPDRARRDPHGVGRQASVEARQLGYRSHQPTITTAHRALITGDGV